MTTADEGSGSRVPDHPFSRDMALREPSEADISSVITLSDRVVQHVAAHAAMDPNDLFKLLGERWVYARWLTDLQRAAGCVFSGVAITGICLPN